MASMGSSAKRSPTRSACSRPSGASAGSPCPSTSGNGCPGFAGSEAPWRTRKISVDPGGGRKPVWRYSTSSCWSCSSLTGSDRTGSLDDAVRGGDWLPSVTRVARLPTHPASEGRVLAKFLSDEWQEQARAVRDELGPDGGSLNQKVKMNLVINEVPTDV